MADFDHMTRDQVETTIRDAFAGVRLGHGVSIRHAAAIDAYDEEISQSELNEVLQSEVTNDWTAVPESELDTDNVAHLDPEGLRYYLPALMLRLLDQYDPAEMWSIGTISALDQRDGHPPGFLQLLSRQQRKAIATYVRALPELVQLDHEDGARIARAFRDVGRVKLPKIRRVLR